MGEFNTLFPNFLTAVKTMRETLLPVAFVLFVVGLMMPIPSAPRSVRGLLLPLGKFVVLALVLAQLPTWGDKISVITNETVTQTLKVDPAKVYDNYTAKLKTQKGAGGANKSWWQKLFEPDAALFEVLISGVLFLFGLLASIIVFYAYLVQSFILYIGYALSPIFIGFLAVRALNGIGTTYCLGLVGVMLWPLGWGCAAMLTDGLLDFMTDQTFLSANLGAPGAAGYGFQNLIGLAALGVWLIFSTIAAPVIIQKAISSGAQAGAAMLSGAATAGVAAATTGASGAASVAAGGGLGRSLAGAAAGVVTGTTGLVGSSMSGSTYSPTGYALGSLAGMAGRGKAKPPKNEQSTSSESAGEASSSGGGDSDGGGGGEGGGDSRTSPPPKAVFDPNDLARDREVAEIKRQYREQKL